MAWHPPILDAVDFPVTTLTIIVNVVICYLLNSRDVPFTSVAVSSESVVVHREYWRIVTAAFSHYEVFHVVANAGSSWASGQLEVLVGSGQFAIFVAILALSSGALDALIRHFLLPATAQAWALGYSGVVCGLMAILSSYESALTLFGLRIPWSFVPFLNIAVIQLLIPRVSFIGHLSGVIVGFAIRWHAFDWVTRALFWNLLPWAALFFFAAWARGHRDAVPWFDVAREPPPGGRVERV
jgi:membrane associated rhomboid family serine protease